MAKLMLDVNFGMCVKRRMKCHVEKGCESLCPLQGYNLALVRPAIHWVFGSGTGLWEDVCNRLEQFRYCFVVFEAAGVALRYRPVGLSESTRSSRHFKYSLELYLALWYWANASRSIRYAVESGCYDSIDLGSSLTSWRSMNLTEMVLDHPFRFLSLLRTSEMFVKPIDYLLRVCEILRHCEDNAYVSYSTSGYLIWKSILWPL